MGPSTYFPRKKPKMAVQIIMKVRSCHCLVCLVVSIIRLARGQLSPAALLDENEPLSQRGYAQRNQASRYQV